VELQSDERPWRHYITNIAAAQSDRGSYSRYTASLHCYGESRQEITFEMTTKRTTAPTRARVPKTTSPRPTTRRKAAPAPPVEVSVPPPAEGIPPPIAADATPIVEPLRAAAQAVESRAGRPAIDAEHIRTRAYFLSLERRGQPGNPVEDWLAAERELAAGLRH
jgi:hypothetical protein